MRRLTFPEPISYSDPKTPESLPWGLADMISERALSNPELLSTVENCNRVIGLLDKFRPFRSRAQTGKHVLLGDSDYEFLGIALGACLRKFAQESGGALPLAFMSDIAGYMRAFHQAEVVRDTDGAPAATMSPGVA